MPHSSPSASYPERAAFGAALIVAAALGMAFQDAVVKYVSAGLPLWQLYVLRALIVIPVLAGGLTLLGGRGAARPKALGWALLRSLLLVLMYIAFYGALPLLSLSVVATAYYTAPLFITLLSALLLGEPVGGRGWAAIGIGFLGVLAILRPGTEAFTLLALLPVLSGLFYALAAIITRSKCLGEAPLVLSLTLNVCFLLVGAVASAAVLLWNPTADEAAVYPFLLGRWVELGAREWGFIVLLAILIVAVSAGVAKAYQSGPPVVIATFDYSYLVFAAFWSFVIFAELPDAATVVGMVLITSAGLLALRRPRLPLRAPAAERVT
ncbi:MAG: DMT family transporter [Kiloniellales bacterium]